ncbi:MAG: putative DNA-binding domain-containing protein [Deltaproteobacteria bacterium]|jgi:hypothetical protein|nr:putative DNA-binding domain-containing protein [Deltaproteobacteria bacterium]
MLVDTAKAMQRVCFDAEPSEEDLALLGSRERWLVYRSLVRARLVGVVEAALPRTASVIGRDSFARSIDEWLSTGGPKTRYFRQVPNELADLAIPIWRNTAEPWIADLARYEITSWSVRHAPPNRVPDAELSFDARPVVGTAVAIVRLDYSVHETPIPASGYERQPVILCVYRNEKHRSMTQILNPLAADLLEAWQRETETVTQSVQRVADAHGTAIGPAFIEKLSELMTKFTEQGILLGGQDPPP